MINGVPVEIALTDFEGSPVVGSRSVADMTTSWRKPVLDQGVPHLSMERSSSGAYLVVAEPLFRIRTLSPEGALFHKINLSRMIADLNDSGGGEPFRLLQHGAPILRNEQGYGGNQGVDPMLTHSLTHSLAYTHPLDLPELLAPLALAVEVRADPEVVGQPLDELTML